MRSSFDLSFFRLQTNLVALNEFWRNNSFLFWFKLSCPICSRSSRACVVPRNRLATWSTLTEILAEDTTTRMHWFASIDWIGEDGFGREQVEPIICGRNPGKVLKIIFHPIRVVIRLVFPIARYIRWYARQHVLCTEEMCEQLEKMITPEVKKERHFIDDPYAPYHKRHGMDCGPYGKQKTQKSYIKTTFDYWNFVSKQCRTSSLLLLFVILL